MSGGRGCMCEEMNKCPINECKEGVRVSIRC